MIRPTVCQSIRASRVIAVQGRRLHNYLTAAITADLNGQPIPTPQPP